MDLSFLSPEAGLVALAAAVPLALLLHGERRTRRLRAALRLDPPARTQRGLLVASVVAVPALLGLGAMQPVVDRSTEHVTRTDAEIVFVVDTSRSMVASRTATSRTRLERARAGALRVRSELGQVPAGVASMTDRLLPHLFPTPDSQVFAATLERSVGIDQPPPVNWNRTATTLGALSALATRNFFSREVRRRVAIVFTDAESRAFATENVGALFRRRPAVRAIFVRVGNADERVYTAGGEVEEAYRPPPTAGTTIRALAAATGGDAFDESQLGDVVEAAKRAVGTGRTEVRGNERNKLALAPYSVALAFLPLGLLLWRRNL
jgi:von Willebrand factor type A domain